MRDRPPAEDNPLDRECVAFTRYLTTERPSGYVIEKYRDAHARSELLRTDAAGAFDHLLLKVARTHALGSWLVDAYTAVFLRRTLVRRKWVLLVAILESVAPAAEFFDVPDSGGRAALAAQLAVKGIAFLVALGLSGVMFMPLHLILAAAARRHNRSSARWTG
ncbi:MAG: hypothetical protein ACRD1H_19875 [Vicinamibacterales bacterium]